MIRKLSSSPDGIDARLRQGVVAHYGGQEVLLGMIRQWI